MKVDNHYHSFGELAEALGLKPVHKVTKDKKKLEEQRERFVNRHKCKACGQPMVWVRGTNTMTCINPECKGIKVTRTNPETGETTVSYITSYDVLDDLGATIAGNIFE